MICSPADCQLLNGVMDDECQFGRFLRIGERWGRTFGGKPYALKFGSQFGKSEISF